MAWYFIKENAKKKELLVKLKTRNEENSLALEKNFLTNSRVSVKPNLEPFIITTVGEFRKPQVPVINYFI